ncbi:hypothetical protein [Naasia aerilata]|uniref:hypothetical protein n=1 Tax=Naasia aerilata TaxID=1162966 RepID=UPI002572730F|nr:hypothetical protein [Naasia aerilata]
MLLYLLVEGIPLRSDRDADTLRIWAGERLEAGPRLPEHQLDARRYLLTSLVDDLLDADDPFTASMLRADLVRELAQFLLLACNRWLGSGKWLVRRLRDFDDGLATRLAAVADERDSQVIAAITAEPLAPHGGLLEEDFVR